MTAQGIVTESTIVRIATAVAVLLVATLLAAKGQSEGCAASNG
jgi:hypothetical protein